jgi:predicted ester cyclase
MTNYQHSKKRVLQFHEALEAASANDIVRVMDRHMSSDYTFRGVHPFNELEGIDAVAEALWKPLLGAFRQMQRRQDIFMAGPNEIDDTEWVISMGHFMGLFDNDWLGIPSTGKIAFVPYTEFHRISDGKICESAFFCDILRLMQQVGLTPLPMQTGAEFMNPGPRTHDGLLFDKQDEAVTAKTQQLITQMKNDFVATYGGHVSPETLAKTWHDNMAWFGPSGIGAAYTIDGFLNQHERPFRNGLDNLTFNGHICRFAEGHYVGWFGWPNLSMTPAGGLMGLPASDKRVGMRIVDMYRREGDKLAENWIFIDILHFLMQQGVDVLERNRRILRR